jgi:hypothetical protein
MYSSAPSLRIDLVTIETRLDAVETFLGAPRLLEEVSDILAQ